VVTGGSQGNTMQSEGAVEYKEAGVTGGNRKKTGGAQGAVCGARGARGARGVM